MLNSFWSRFGMRDDLTRTKIVNSEKELRDLILSAKLNVKSIIPINDDKLLVSYEVRKKRDKVTKRQM